MIFLFGGGGGFLGNVFKGLLQPITGAEKPDKNLYDASKLQAQERASQEEALRKERALANKRSGRSKTLLTGGGSTAGINTQQKTLLGGV